MEIWVWDPGATHLQRDFGRENTPKPPLDLPRAAHRGASHLNFPSTDTSYICRSSSRP